MTEYQRLETKIEKYLTRVDVKKTTSIVSVYDVYKALEDKFKELREIQLNSKLIEKINNDNTVIRQTGKIFKDKEVIYTKILDNILATTTKNTSKITFFYGQGKHPEKFTILKDFNDNDIYFSEDTKPDKNFVTKYYDDILYIFDTLEVFAKLTKSDIGISKENYNLKPMVFSDGFLTLTIAFDTLGKVTTNISINKTEDTNQIYKRNWYTRKSLSEIVSENNDEILKKIPININNIDPKYQAIINEYTKYNQ